MTRLDNVESNQELGTGLVILKHISREVYIYLKRNPFEEKVYKRVQYKYIIIICIFVLRQHLISANRPDSSELNFRNQNHSTANNNNKSGQILAAIQAASYPSVTNEF